MKIVFIISFLFSLFAQQTVQSGTQNYSDIIKRIKIKIHRFFHPAKSNTVVLAVSGVRGNKFDVRKKIYWKTELSPKMQNKLNEEAEVVKNIIKDFDPKNSQSIKEVVDFLEKNPNSFFSKELKELLLSSQEQKNN